MRKLFAISLTLIGFTAIIGQIVLIRELMVLFYGNELTVGFMLGAWLLWTAAGSGLVGRMLSKLKRLRLTYGLTQLGLALLVPASIVAIRASQVIWGRTQGEITGLVPIMVTTLVTLGPFCIFSGSLYTLGCNIFSRKLEKASVSIGRVYVLEAIGAGLGGFLASFVLIRFLSSFQIAGLLSFLNIFISWLLLSEYLSNKLLKKILTFSIVSLSVLLVFLGYPYLDRLSNRLLWKGFNLIHTENTIYGNIALTRLEESTSFFENGLLMYTQPDIFYAEEAVHFALLEHPDPRRLLLIGGGIGGSLKQALLHPQLESDPDVHPCRPQ
ncbi:MAG: hypothetical protein ONB05_08305 [candidate division KSB1 bacterium]|nr:hypothetical protein [candidate division KSB1 bacterium]